MSNKSNSPAIFLYGQVLSLSGVARVFQTKRGMLQMLGDFSRAWILLLEHVENSALSRNSEVRRHSIVSALSLTQKATCSCNLLRKYYAVAISPFESHLLGKIPIFSHWWISLKLFKLFNDRYGYLNHLVVVYRRVKKGKKRTGRTQ